MKTNKSNLQTITHMKLWVLFILFITISDRSTILFVMFVQVTWGKGATTVEFKNLKIGYYETKISMK